MKRRLSDTVSQAWDDLPDTARQGLMTWLDRLPGGLKAWRGLVDQAA